MDVRQAKMADEHYTEYKNIQLSKDLCANSDF
jgi:hypothetical protein